MKICIVELENRIMFKIRIWYYVEFLTPESMELLRSTKSKITKNTLHEKQHFS